MTAEAALRECRSIFLDTAPTIYYLSTDSSFNLSTVQAIAYCLRAGIRIVASPIALAESLANEPDPFKQRTTRNLLTTQIVMVNIEVRIAEEAARLRRTTKLKLLDCLQLAQLAKAPVALRFVLVGDLEP